MNKRIVDRTPPEVAGEESRSFIKGVYVLPLLVILLLLLNALLFQRILFSSQGIPGFRNQCAMVEELETKVRTQKEENQKLFKKIQALKNSPRGQERMVREELGWVRENELLIEFPRKNPDPPQ